MKIRVQLGRTVQAPKYEPINLNIAIEKEVHDDINAKQELDKLVNGLAKYIKTKLGELIENGF